MSPHKPALISLISSLDSYVIFLSRLAISIPIGIFFAIAFGLPAVMTIAVLGSWTIATLYRWIIREWNSQPSLRAWMGGPYLQTALGYAIGPVLASWFYVLVMTIIFTLPLHGLAISFIYGLIISLGDPNPPGHTNYDLVITVFDGIIIPIEIAKIFMVNMGILIFYIVSILNISIVGISVSLLILFWRLKNYHNKMN